MALLKLEIPPGVYRHGTDYEGSNRWHESNLIRWEGTSLRPVGGWITRVADAIDFAPRGALTWFDNTHVPHIAAGTYNQLFAFSSAGTVYDITPTSLTAGSVDASQNLGYGGFGYGDYAYGTERPSDNVWQEATSWSLDNWGEYLVACSVDDGNLYEWQLNTAVVAAPIANAPVDNVALVVTDERFLFALGAGNNPRKVAWCDRENNTVWTPEATNEAGDIELNSSGVLMCGVSLRGRTLLLTSNDAHVATYAGPPTVYGFERVGSDCGAISRLSLVGAFDGAFWMGSNGFFYYDGSFVKSVKCDVQDYIFGDINTSQISKVSGILNNQFNEIWWFYPSGDSVENNRYVTYNYKYQHWTFGTLDRTSGCDAGVFSKPIWFDSLGNIYTHETGYSHDSNQAFVESGPISLANGDQVMKVTQMIPDEETEGQVTATFKTRFYPNTVETSHGPYAMDSPTSLRFTGRQIRMRLTGEELTNWRAGIMRLEVVAGGRR